MTAGRATSRRAGLAVAAALVALSAWGGAAGLATGGLALGHDLEQRLPFRSPVVGALALALVVAVPFTALAVSAWRGSPSTDQLALVAGALLVGWIVVELAFIRSLSFFHPLYLVIGGLFAFSGRHALGRDRDTAAHGGGSSR